MLKSSINILPLLKSILSGYAREQDVNSLVRVAYQYAYARLRQLVVSRRLHLQSFYLTLEGIAFDCIAELFQRNEEGMFVDLLDYFTDERAIDMLDEADAQHLFRILVFRKLQDGIARLYKENDPILSKILRNVKLAVQAIPEIHSFERMGQTFLHACAEEGRNDHLPEYPIEQLEAELTTRVQSNSNVRDYIKILLEILNSQEQYRRFYALIDIAVITKRVIASERVPLECVCRIDESLLQFDIDRIVNESV